MKKSTKMFLTVLSIFMAFVVFWLAHTSFLFFAHEFDLDFLDIDHCLDMGGVWDYDQKECKIK